MVYNFPKIDFDKRVQHWFREKYYYAHFTITNDKDYSVTLCPDKRTKCLSGDVIDVLDIRDYIKPGKVLPDYIWKVFNEHLKELSIREDF
jgi:hypothetical protein